MTVTLKGESIVVSVKGGVGVIERKICASWSMAIWCDSPSIEMGKAGCGLHRAKQRLIADRTAALAEERAGIFP